MRTLILAAALAVVGLGVGISTSAASTAAIEAAPIELAGSASGTNSMMRYLGSILGTGMLAGVLTTTGGAPPAIEASNPSWMSSTYAASAASSTPFHGSGPAAIGITMQSCTISAAFTSSSPARSFAIATR